MKKILTPSLKTSIELEKWNLQKPTRTFFLHNKKQQNSIKFIDLRKDDKFIAFDGEKQVEDKEGHKIFLATSDPYLNELAIGVIEVEGC